MDNTNNHHLTKKEKYLLKKQRKEQERLQKARRKKTRRIVAILLPTLIIVGGIVFGLIKYSPEEEIQGISRMEISPLEYDLGTISMSKGLVKKTFEIKSVGEGDLKVDSISTSCHCTTAILKVGDRESPKFGMHNNPVFWSQRIAPGQIGFLEVTFDPAFHGPQGVGQNVRTVYLSTNDPQNKKAEVKLMADVVQ